MVQIWATEVLLYLDHKEQADANTLSYRIAAAAANPTWTYDLFPEWQKAPDPLNDKDGARVDWAVPDEEENDEIEALIRSAGESIRLDDLEGGWQ